MPSLTRREFLRWGAAGAAAAVGGGLLEACSRRAKTNVVNFFNWSNYIGKETLPNFEKETGIKVNYENFSGEEEMFSKIRSGVRGYDLIVATDYMTPKLKALRLVDPIPHDLLPGISHLEPRFADPIYDPGLAFTVPYLWGTTGIGFNAGKVPRPESWWSLWDSKFKGRMSMLDNVHDAIACALVMLGLPADTKNEAEIEKAKALLIKQRSLLKHYTSSTYIDELVNGELWMAQGWSGDVLQSARENKKVDYLIPKEGSFIYVDNLCLVRGSPNRENAVRLMDYLLRPQVAAEIANTVRYATPNASARKLLDPKLLKDPRVFPTADIEKRLHFTAPLDPETDELWNRAWQEVKLS